MSKIMTPKFKSIMEIVVMVPICLLAFLLFFPTLGWSWEVFDKIGHAICREDWYN